MNIIKIIMHEVCGAKKPKFFYFTLKGTHRILLANGEIWQGKTFKTKKKLKYVYKKGRWETPQGRPAAPLKDVSKKLIKELKKLGFKPSKKHLKVPSKISPPKIKYKKTDKAMKEFNWKKLEKDPKKYANSLAIPKLVALIKLLKSRYYVEGEEPLVTDEVYDIIEDVLRKRKPNHKELKKVGYLPKVKGRVKLPFFMPSLDNLKTEETTNSWLEKHPGPYVVSYKGDGIAIGILGAKTGNKLYTRGKGHIGQDISHLNDALKIPQVPVNMQARAEIMLSKANFKKYFPTAKGTPRNSAGGLIGRDNIDPALFKTLKVIAFKIYNPSMKPSQQMKKLKQLGFNVMPHVVIKKLKGDSLTLFLKKKKSKFKFDMDGLVIEQDIITKVTKNENPKNARAFKPSSLSVYVDVPVKEVEWNPSKHKYLKPRIIIKPTRIGGVMVEHFTGHNAFFILHGYRYKEINKGFPERPIGKGAIIRCIHSGDTIPHIVKVLKGVKNPDMPKQEYEWNTTQVDIYIPSGTESIRSNLKKASTFFSYIGIKDFASGYIEKMFNAGIDTIPKICKVTKTKLLELPGIQAKMANTIVDGIQTALKGIELHVLMAASGCFGVGMGRKRIAAILEKYPDIHKQKLSTKAIIDMISTIPGFKGTTATVFADGLPKFKKFMREMPPVRIKGIKKVKKVGNRLNNQYIVFTGVRDKELETDIRANGGEVGDSKSKMTILIVKDLDTDSSKAKKAKAKGIPIMTPETFKKKYKL